MKKVGGFIFNIAVETVRIYVTAWVAAGMVADRNIVSAKEGTMRAVFDAQSLDLSHLDPAKVSYEPKNIHTEAIYVTPENIGKLSLEFEEELFYDVDGRAYFVFSAKRFDSHEPDGQKAPNELYVRLTDWIVPLWDELHVFRNVLFQNTFTFDFEHGGQHSAMASLARPYVSYEEDGVMTVAPVLAPKVVPVVDYDIRMGDGSRLPSADSLIPNDRVYVRGTRQYGTVTVVDVDMGGGLSGIEVKLDDGVYRTFVQGDLDLYDRKYDANSGEVEGPGGTQIMPRVDE
jgi:hypothetical protein